MEEEDLRPWLTRPLRGAHLVVLDTAAAVVLVAIYVVLGTDRPDAVPPLYTGPAWLGVLVALGVGLPIAVRRRWPVPVLLTVLAFMTLATLLDITREPYAATTIALYTVALAEPRRRALRVLVLAMAAAAVAIALGAAGSAAWSPRDVLSVTAFVWVTNVASWTVGRAARERRSHAAHSAEQLAREAVAGERLRIARELHDVVAHSMSLISVKAAVANHVADAHPEEARSALRVIEATSRGALAEMRGLLGILRADADADAGPDLAPAPGLAALEELAERTAMAGVAVELDVRATAELPEGVGLSVYRIVQEALTNVVQHAAPTRCRVEVLADEREVAIEVADDGLLRPPDDGSGHGIVGMRERAALYGGGFAAGPRPSGGFTVSAHLPYGTLP